MEIWKIYEFIMTVLYKTNAFDKERKTQNHRGHGDGDQGTYNSEDEALRDN